MHEKEREKEEGRRRGGEGKRGGEKKRERNACGNFSLFPPPHPLASSCPYFSYKHGTTRFHFDLTLSNSFVPLAQNSSFEHPTTRREQSEGKLSLVSSFVLPLPTLFLSALRGLDDSFFSSFFSPFFSHPLSPFEISLQQFNISKRFCTFRAKMYSFMIHGSFGSPDLSAQSPQFVEIGPHHPRIKRSRRRQFLRETLNDPVPSRCDRLRVTKKIHPPRFPP